MTRPNEDVYITVSTIIIYSIFPIYLISYCISYQTFHILLYLYFVFSCDIINMWFFQNSSKLEHFRIFSASTILGPFTNIPRRVVLDSSGIKTCTIMAGQPTPPNIPQPGIRPYDQGILTIGSP